MSFHKLEKKAVRLRRTAFLFYDQKRVKVLLVTALILSYLVSLNNSRPTNIRRISLVPAPISYSLASRQ